MKAVLENINQSLNTSFKAATYHNKDFGSCKTTGWHVHPEYEIVFVKNGSGMMEIDNKVRHYEDGTLLLLGPNIPHIGFGNNEKEDNLEVVIQFRETFLTEKLLQFPECRSLLKLQHLAKKGVIFHDEIHKALSERFESFERIKATEQLSHLVVILDTMAKTSKYNFVSERLVPYDFNSDELQRLQLIFDHINNNYHRPLSTKDIADQVGLTTNSFCRFFKKVTQQSFIQFLNDYRIRKAVELFNDQNLSVTQVMYRCGFNDASYFSKQFKKHQLITPTEFLQRTA